MQVEPASIDQIRMAETGELVAVDKDVGGVAADLEKIDAGLKVRFPAAAKDPAWIVYHEGHPGCPHNGAGGENSSYLVLTARASQNASGTWEGLDQRVVKRIMEIGHSSYDFAKELEAGARRAKREKQAEASEHMGVLSEQAAHILRKDLGAKYKGGIIVPRAV